MQKLNEAMQNEAALKVVEDLVSARDVFLSWSALWWETYENCVMPSEYFEEGSWFDIEHMSELSQVDRHSLSHEYRGMPLKSFMIGKYPCAVSTIKWSNIETNNSIRNIVFDNTGDISLTKRARGFQTLKKPRQISYDAKYNVLYPDYELKISRSTILPDGQFNSENYSISFSNNCLSRKYDGFEVVDDFETGKKSIRIVRKYEKPRKGKDAEEKRYSVEYLVNLNPDDSLRSGEAYIRTHKTSGKVNGTYRFAVSPESGISANYYSRGGIKVDMSNRPMLMQSINPFQLPSGEGEDISEVTLDEESESEKSVINTISKRKVDIDFSEFNIEAIVAADKKVMEMLESIKGEIPLSGLRERIEETIRIIGRKKHTNGSANSKVLTVKPVDSESI